MMMQIRTREGLAYSVYGGWDSPPDHPGIFVGGGETSAPGEPLKQVLPMYTTVSLNLLLDLGTLACYGPMVCSWLHGTQCTDCHHSSMGLYPLDREVEQSMRAGISRHRTTQEKTTLTAEACGTLSCSSTTEVAHSLTLSGPY